MNIKYKSGISDENQASKWRGTVSVKYTPNFKDLGWKEEYKLNH